MELDSVRKKIVLLYDGIYPPGIADPIPPESKSVEASYVQNEYGIHFGATKASYKKTIVALHIDEAIEDSNKGNGNYYINFLNGSGGMLPYHVAKHVNPTIFEYLIKKPYTCRLGMIVMDFPGEWLIYRIIQSNFSYP